MSRHKINDFDTPFSPAALAKTYPLLLKKAGYKIGFIGKYSVGTKSQPSADYGFYLGEHGLEGNWYGHEETLKQTVR